MNQTTVSDSAQLSQTTSSSRTSRSNTGGSGSSGIRSVKTDAPGVYGKIPANGDFVSRRLSGDFIRYWDEWLQRSLAVSQEQLGEKWLEYYLVSPMWRFVLSSGVVDNASWAGVLVPSVDSVGRYFPLTIAMSMKVASLMDFFVQGSEWFQQIEECALAALHENLSIEELNERLMTSSCSVTADYAPRDLTSVNEASLQMDLAFPEQCTSTLFPLMFEQLVRQQYRSYSAWWSQGSDNLGASFNLSAHLPDAGMYASFLDGDWEQRGWHKAYDLLE